jgi:hypothetical protein
MTNDGPRVTVFTLSGLACIAGYLAGTADQRIGMGNRWIMYVYKNLSRLDINFLFRLEAGINLELNRYGLPEIHVSHLWRQ